MGTSYLQRPEGRLAYDDSGAGPLVVCIPGMGDVRAEYRFLTPRLVAAGYRVVTVDLRGHGESDTTFTDVERATAGDDVLALIRALGPGSAHVIGTSYGAAGAVWAAAEAPELVSSVTLIGPFVRDVPVNPLQALAFRLLLARPWGLGAWIRWYRKLHPGFPPEDLDEYVVALRRNLAEPGRMAALRAMARTSTRAIDPRLDDLRSRVLVVMGTADPDFPDPAAEAQAIAARTGGAVLLVDGAGHYPHVEDPERTAGRIATFLAGCPVAC